MITFTMGSQYLFITHPKTFSSFSSSLITHPCTFYHLQNIYKFVFKSLIVLEEQESLNVKEVVQDHATQKQWRRDLL